MNIEELPIKIYRNSFIVKSTLTQLKDSEIEKYIDDSVNEFLENAHEERKLKIIDNKYIEILEKDVTKLIEKYIEKTHMFEIIDFKEKDDEENEEDKEITLDKCLIKYSLIANKILKDIKKSRKNDYADVLNNIKEKLTNFINKEEDDKVKEDKNKDVDEEIDCIEEIDEEQDKKNKLEKLIDGACEQLISHARSCVSSYSKLKLNKYIENSNIDEELSNYMISFKKNNLSKYKENLNLDIINLFDYIISRCLNKISWIDDGKHIIMVNKITKEGNNLVITSGTVSPTKISFDLNRVFEIHRGGSTFTILIEGELKNGIN